jgi:aspartyl/asparaginyl-tRNA synthetase|eukprot:COSAG01_NODE_11949_length_1829_cov_1.215029_2_plen_39_part_00
MSGAQRIHEPELLIERCKAWQVPVESIQVGRRRSIDDL